MQAKNPQKLKQNCIIFLYYQTTGRRGMSTPGVRVCRIRMPLGKIRKDSWTKRPTATLTGWALTRVQRCASTSIRSRWSSQGVGILVGMIWRRGGMSTPGVEVWRGRMPLKQKYLIFFCHPTNRNLFHWKRFLCDAGKKPAQPELN